MLPVVGIIVTPGGIGEVTLLNSGPDANQLARFLIRIAPALPVLSKAATGGSPARSRQTATRTARPPFCEETRPPDRPNGTDAEVR